MPRKTKMETSEPVKQPSPVKQEQTEKKKRAPSAYAMFCKQEYEKRKSEFTDKGKFKAFLQDPSLRQKWQDYKMGKVSEPEPVELKKSRKSKKTE